MKKFCVQLFERQIVRKVLILLFLITLVLFTSFILKNSSEQIWKNNTTNLNFNYTTDNNFLIGAADDFKDYNFKYTDSALGFTLWHNYPNTTEINGKHYPDGWTYWAPGDHLFSLIGDYQEDVTRVLNTIGSHNMKAWMQRPKIEWLVYGQRSDYGCVDTAYADHDLWFYTFQSPGHVGMDIPESLPYGNGNYVRYCSINKSSHRGKVDNSGLVVSRLRTNAEQCHRSHDFDAYRWDSEHDWYIKPRIRIDSMVAHNNPDMQVCEIIIIAQDGYSILKDVIIKAGNFLDNNLNYDGRYIEEYYHLSQTDSLLIHGDWGDSWCYSARGNKATDTDNNKVDIKVYWFGNCDMWIDYIRVDNDIANDLLTSDTTNAHHREYLNWLQWEAQNIACNGGQAPSKFYLELFEFNQIPCMEYVNHKLDSLCNKHIGIIAYQFTFYQYHMAWEDRGKIMKADQIIRQYINKVGATEITLGHSPFTSVESVDSTYCRIPNTLPIVTGEKILAKPISPAEYDAWLQSDLDTISYYDEGEGNDKHNYKNGMHLLDPCPQQPQLAGKFRFELQLANQISKQANIPFIAWGQAHQWLTHCSETEREPTSEELDLISNIPICYGSKGIMYFMYDGWQTGAGYAYGFTEADGVTPRYTNVYGQPKWDKFISIIQRLKKWSPYIMSFDNTQTNSYIYRLPNERNDLISNSYIDKVITLKPGNFKNGQDQNNKTYINNKLYVYDYQQQTYLQVATFKQSAPSNNLYFMIENKRCSPFISDTTEDQLGGKRWINILFKTRHSEMESSKTWKITDLADPNWSITFDKTQNQYVDLGPFMPGEGKLYSMSPQDITIPKEFDLFQNYPNPFNPMTHIGYSLPKDLKVEIKIYDILGREIKTLVNEFQKAGYYLVSFDGTNYASGVYFYKIKAGEFADSKKMVLVK
jgi:hypothetical protein